MAHLRRDARLTASPGCRHLHLLHRHQPCCHLHRLQIYHQTSPRSQDLSSRFGQRHRTYAARLLSVCWTVAGFDSRLAVVVSPRLDTACGSHSWRLFVPLRVPRVLHVHRLLLFTVRGGQSCTRSVQNPLPVRVKNFRGEPPETSWKSNGGACSNVLSLRQPRALRQPPALLSVTPLWSRSHIPPHGMRLPAAPSDSRPGPPVMRPTWRPAREIASRSPRDRLEIASRSPPWSPFGLEAVPNRQLDGSQWQCPRPLPPWM